MNATLRAGGLALLAAAVWVLCYTTNEPHLVRGPDAAPTVFSAARADAVLARILGPERPHPAGSAENTAVRARILSEFERLGINATTHRALGCNYAERRGFIGCGTVTNIVAEVKPGEGKAIVLLAHYDSVPAGPGAADDGSGVATVLETARALKARGLPGKHPILAVLTDGEEYGLLGAAAFVHDPALKARVGAVVNVEARGNRGPSLLFQTSPGNAPLIDAYAKGVERYNASSLFAEIYKRMPNDTDLTVFIRNGFPSLNFAFSGNVAHYHTPLDVRANLSRATLQQQGDNMLGSVVALGEKSLQSLKGSDEMYLSLLGIALPRLPQWTALPLALTVFITLIFASLLARERRMRWDQNFLSMAMPPVLLVGCGLAGWGLHAVAALVSGAPDPSFAHPALLRTALFFALGGLTLAVSTMAPPHGLARGAWLWLAVLGIAAAIFAPGASPYFIFPCLIAAIVLVLAARTRTRWLGRFGQICLLLAATLNLVIWFSLAGAGETLMGLKLHPLFTIPAALGLVTLVPLLAIAPLESGLRRVAVALCFLCAVAAAAASGLMPAFTAQTPQRLNLTYVDDHTRNRALWAADANAPLPAALRAAAAFSAKPEQATPINFFPAYIAPAGTPRFAAPGVKLAPITGGYALTLAGSNAADQMFVIIPKAAKLKAVKIGSWNIPLTSNARENTIIVCLTPDCRDLSLTLLTAAAKPFDILFGERRIGLPPEGQKLRDARPKEAVQSQMGDGTVVLSRVRVPG
ncbi:MAG TPA: M20/M25/M40 family metallo-hydrolase [Rhizomicrobium sp.]|nr:M20/M25/M40 family metallo-hydrolase [Rhizomicrobium sp.]